MTRLSFGDEPGDDPEVTYVRINYVKREPVEPVEYILVDRDEQPPVVDLDKP